MKKVTIEVNDETYAKIKAYAKAQQRDTKFVNKMNGANFSTKLDSVEKTIEYFIRLELENTPWDGEDYTYFQKESKRQLMKILNNNCKK